jgi:hypothetical protein
MDRSPFWAIFSQTPLITLLARALLQKFAEL